MRRSDFWRGDAQSGKAPVPCPGDTAPFLSHNNNRTHPGTLISSPAHGGLKPSSPINTQRQTSPTSTFRRRFDQGAHRAIPNVGKFERHFSKFPTPLFRQIDFDRFLFAPLLPRIRSVPSCVSSFGSRHYKRATVSFRPQRRILSSDRRLSRRLLFSQEKTAGNSLSDFR